MGDIKLAAAWKTAAQDLGIDVVTPYGLDVDGERLEFPVLVKDFGHKNGTLVTADMAMFNKVLDSEINCSVLNEEEYGTYNRNKFIEVLRDWGYSGKSCTPDWYAE